MIVAVDYDGTLEVGGKVNEPLVQMLRNYRQRGAVIILWTCREGKRLRDALQKLSRSGFRPDYVNCNAPQAIARMGHDSRKVYADLYIDDKNMLIR